MMHTKVCFSVCSLQQPPNQHTPCNVSLNSLHLPQAVSIWSIKMRIFIVVKSNGICEYFEYIELVRFGEWNFLSKVLTNPFTFSWFLKLSKSYKIIRVPPYCFDPNHHFLMISSCVFLSYRVWQIATISVYRA